MGGAGDTKTNKMQRKEMKETDEGSSDRVQHASTHHGKKCEANKSRNGGDTHTHIHTSSRVRYTDDPVLSKHITHLACLRGLK